MDRHAGKAAQPLEAGENLLKLFLHKLDSEKRGPPPPAKNSQDTIDVTPEKPDHKVCQNLSTETEKDYSSWADDNLGAT